jgi:thioredoxin 1
MATLDVTENSFADVVTGGGIVLVDCWASWCGKCRTFAPVFEQIAGRFPKHTFAKLDTQKEKSLVKDLEIEHIPTLLLYRDGLLLFKQPGYYEEEELEDIVRQAESLNMDEVRASIEREASAERPNNSG